MPSPWLTTPAAAAPPRKRHARVRSSSALVPPPPFLVPLGPLYLVPTTAPTDPPPAYSARKSRSTPHLAPHAHPLAALVQYTAPCSSSSSGGGGGGGDGGGGDTGAEDDCNPDPDYAPDADAIYAAPRDAVFTHDAALRARMLHPRAKAVTTTRGIVGAGETETEADEPPRRLPTARFVPSAPLVPPPALAALAPLLFAACRLLAAVPGALGAAANLYLCIYGPAHARIDRFVAAVWALLTAAQCLALTTGLLVRWRVYYPPLATLIRLLALQALCWPLTHLTLTILNHAARPAACWAVIGTTTSASRAVQIWVTSNLWWDGAAEGWRRRQIGGRWGGRRWDWGAVGWRCALPVGLCYFVMAWAEVARRELGGC
ncbi:N-glycosylation protein-domain-containing protein [Vararia minispora EC-137]|uniref:N-glycosylation protein-domain-containing protein n=1 Tax=Vararia minispora EC-137 TaxID=1314806 RepID=A0ACB8QB74_9AGAM|nr:N-glycosylation protein-domain-containing protein [Vararia minispora EC-137]